MTIKASGDCPATRNDIKERVEKCVEVEYTLLPCRPRGLSTGIIEMTVETDALEGFSEIFSRQRVT